MKLPAALQRRQQTTADGLAFVGAPQDGAAPIARFATDPALEELLQALARGFGRRHWWPAATPFEVLVGAILTQNTAWTNVEHALANVRAFEAARGGAALTAEDLLALAREPDPLAKPRSFDAAAPATHTLEALIRPSGAFRQKARKLVAASEWLLAVGGWPALAKAPLADLRTDLLGVFGIGPETADSILCYAAGRPTVVIDAYARRVLGRHGLKPDAATCSYADLHAWLTARLVPYQLVLEETHALFVAAGYNNCKPTAQCDSCPAPLPDTLL